MRVDPTGDEQVVASADVYGRGPESDAQERVMLLFRFRSDEEGASPQAGEELELRVAAPDGDGYVTVELDIFEID